MAFGSIMRFDVAEFAVELAPLNRDVMSEFIQPGMQSAVVTKYLMTQAKVLEDEYAWYDNVRTSNDSVVWGIWIIHGDGPRELVGSTGLKSITFKHFSSARTGSVIFKTEYWGKGIASTAHKARTWYAFNRLGIDRLWSEVIQANTGSRRALEKAGYYVTHVKRNDMFADGRLHHVDQLECINPDAKVWKRWWGNDKPGKSARKARMRTMDAMVWAHNNLTLA